MSTGETFTDPRLIRPGWVLDVPLPAHNLQASDDGVTYRVQSGDSLWSLAERLLGDGFHWIEIWRLNEGREMAGGVRFSDPNLIYPGWLLELPVEVKTEAGAPPAEPTQTPSTEPAEPASTPEPEPPEPLAELEPTPEPTTKPGGSPKGGGFEVPLPDKDLVLATAAGLAVAGGVALTVRAVARRLRNDGVRVFGEDGRAKRPRGDAGKIVLAARALLSGLTELGFDDVRLLTAREAERFTEYVLECAPGDAEALARAEYDLGRRLACRVNARVEDGTHVSIRLSSFQRLAGLLVGDRAPDDLLLVPVGASADGVHYLNLAAAGAVLVAGDPHETREVVSAWTATLAATHAPDELTLLLSSELGDQNGGPDEAGLAEDADGRTGRWLMAELRDTLVAREGARNPGTPMPVVAFVGLPETWTSEFLNVETLLHHGPAQGIYIVAVVESAADAEGIGPFGASVVFAGAASSAGEESEVDVGPGELTLSVGRRSPVVLQPIAVRRQSVPSMRPMTDVELEEWWEHEARLGGRRAAAPEPQTGEALAEAPGWEDPASPLEREVVCEAPADGLGAVDDVGVDTNQPIPEESDAGEQATEGPSIAVEEEGRDGDRVAFTSGEPPYRVHCFGSFEVTDAAGRPVRWRIQKARELLAYLLSVGGSAPRDEIAEALWPEGLPQQVDRQLANAAYHLRRALRDAGEGEQDVLWLSGGRYHLQTRLFRVDAEALKAHLRRAEDLDGAEALREYDRVRAIYQDDFLAREPFEWAGPHRREYQQGFLAAAHRAAKLAFDGREVSRALEFYRAILGRDAIDEEAARGAMRCYARLGDTNGVRKVYKALCEALRREFDDDKAEPLSETKALLEDLIRVRAT